MRTPNENLVPASHVELRGMGSERAWTGMARYGINVEYAFGVSVCERRKIARRILAAANERA